MNDGKSGLYNIGFNIFFPTLILLKGIVFIDLTPIARLLLALFFPVVFGIYELINSQKINWMSIIGTVSVLLTGGIGLMKLNANWLAIKEAIVPATIGLVFCMSSFFKKPLISLILNKMLNTPVIVHRLKENNCIHIYTNICSKYTYFVGLSFFLSAFLNFMITKQIVTANPGSTLFMEQLGKLTFLSYIFIAIPCTLILALICYRITSQLTKETGLSYRELLNISS